MVGLPGVLIGLLGRVARPILAYLSAATVLGALFSRLTQGSFLSDVGLFMSSIGIF